MKNISGLVQTTPAYVRDSGDIAQDTLGSAASGAQIGAQVAGPYGALVGGVLGGVYGFSSSMGGKQQEQRLRGSQEIYNRGVEGFTGREDNRYLHTMQARYGMDVNSTNMVEAEKGEKVFDKNWNVLHDFTGKDNPTHEEIEKTGDMSTTKKLPDESVVVPRKDLNKVNTLIKRYKLNGDLKAKSQLDKIKKSYDTPSENMGEARYGMYKAEKGFYNQEGGYYNLTGDKTWDYKYGDDSKWYTRKQGTTEWTDMASNPNYAKGIPSLEQIFNKPQWTAPLGTGNSGEFGANLNYVHPPMVDATIDFDTNSTPPTTASQTPSLESTGYNWNYTPNISQPSIVDPGGGRSYPEDGENQILDKQSFGDKALGALKYTSTVNNLIQGMKTIDPVTRRYVTPEEFKYSDASQTQRKAINEARNASLQATRGKGLSAGQEQAYASQISGQALNSYEQVNEKERARYDAIQQANTQQRNQANQVNTQLANQYDMMDEQARAVKQKYKDTAFSEIASHAMYDEQKRYMQKRDAKRYETDKKTLKLINQLSDKIKFDENGNVTEDSQAVMDAVTSFLYPGSGLSLETKKEKD